jgi:hypothetical protein
MHGDAGAGFGQRDGNARAESARGAGDQRDFALEIEFVENQGNGSFPDGRDGRSSPGFLPS